MLIKILRFAFAGLLVTLQNAIKPTGVHQILKTQNIIRYIALYIDCVLHVYLCNGLSKFLEISESEYAKYHRSRNIIHESAKIFAFSSIKTQLKL